MSTIDAGNIAKGMYILYKDAPHQVIKTEFMNPGKGSAVMRVKFKNVKTGAAQEFTYKTNEKVEELVLDKSEMQYLYHDGQNVYFMDPRSFEQVTVPESLMEDQVGFLTADLVCWVIRYKSDAIGVILPPHVKLKVIESPDAVAGNRVNAPKKTVKLETGIEIQAPLFIKEGETIEIDTLTGEYVSRAN